MSSNTSTIIYAGLDIAKLNLQLHLAGRFYDLPNTAAGHRRLLKLLKAHSSVRIICEATGGYERKVVEALHQAVICLSILNPARVRHFARAQGQRAKTDRIDAAVLSAYGQALQPKPTPVRTESEKHLAELVRRRVQLLEILVAQRQQAERLTLPSLRRQAKSLIRRLEADVAQIEEQLQELRQQTPELDERAQKLRPSPGSVPPPHWRSWLNCLNWAPSIALRLLHWPDWRLTHAKAGSGKAVAPSAEAALRFGALSTWPLWWLPAATQC